MRNYIYLLKWLRFGHEERFLVSNVLYAGAIRVFGSLCYNERLRALHILNEIIDLYSDKELKYKNVVILDAGCGTGKITFFLSQIFEKSTIKGIDINVNRVARAQNKLSQMSSNTSNRLSFDVLDLRFLKERTEYDLIICSETLEHIEEDEIVIKNLYNGLKNDKFAIFTAPTRTLLPAPGHILGRYSYADLKGKLVRAGFNINKICYFSSRYAGYIGWFINHLCKTRYKSITKALRLALHPLLCLICLLDTWIKPGIGGHLLFVAKKKV